MPLFENNRTTRSETAAIAVDRELSEFFHASADRSRAPIAHGCEIGRGERHILLAGFCGAASRCGGSEYLSGIRRRLIGGVREGDRLQAFDLSCRMGAVVGALTMQSRIVPGTEE